MFLPEPFFRLFSISQPLVRQQQQIPLTTTILTNRPAVVNNLNVEVCFLSLQTVLLTQLILSRTSSSLGYSSEDADPADPLSSRSSRRPEEDDFDPQDPLPGRPADRFEPDSRQSGLKGDDAGQGFATDSEDERVPKGKPFGDEEDEPAPFAAGGGGAGRRPGSGEDGRSDLEDDDYPSAFFVFPFPPSCA
jgi:hypothetical protein